MERDKVDDINDLKQYVNNMLYAAYDNKDKFVTRIDFDMWVERMIGDLDEYYHAIFAEQSRITEQSSVVVTDVSAFLDSLNFKTSKEREDAFDLIELFKSRLTPGYPEEFVKWVASGGDYFLVYSPRLDLWEHSPMCTVAPKTYTSQGIFQYWQLNIKDK